MSRLLKRCLKASAWLLLILMVAGFISYRSRFAKGADEASGSVENADVAVRLAFNATLDAERAGANVSSLIVKLNEAGGLLTEAEVALTNGNSSEASTKAGQCVEIAESVKTDAEVLRTSALDEAQTIFWTYFTISMVGGAVFVFVLALVWRRFKHRHVEKVFGMKPEVAHDEA